MVGRSFAEAEPPPGPYGQRYSQDGSTPPHNNIEADEDRHVLRPVAAPTNPEPPSPEPAKAEPSPVRLEVSRFEAEYPSLDRQHHLATVRLNLATGAHEAADVSTLRRLPCKARSTSAPWIVPNRTSSRHGLVRAPVGLEPAELVPVPVGQPQYPPPPDRLQATTHHAGSAT